ncbi:hypothetical protein M9H77_05359 [Catharanthus roseus]|uniref:Uncharacterized protein n=1 Tax=Catharanthus roseus TaxID=4058 RepID=A0ACC0CHB5_CATRO|nr:hypothetical protein M9H77_05359 [Catharanthus roseus]
METAFSLQLQRSAPCESVYVTSFSLPIAADVRHLHPPENARYPMRYPIRNSITNSIAISFTFNQTNLLCHSFAANNNLYKDAMADEAKKKNSSSIESAIEQKEVKKKESEKLTPEKIPPPPEKPLPGDCCGSGCVRCVWDVYYEELEEYNKLYKSSPDSNRPS